MINEVVRSMPTVLYCERERLEKASRFGPVVRNFFVVECNEVGHGSVEINGKEFPFGPGACYVLLPGDTVVHTCDGDDPRGGIYCLLDGPMLAQYFNALGITSETPFLPEHVFSLVQGRLEAMLHDFHSRDAGTLPRQAGSIYGLLGELLKDKPSSTREDTISKAIGIMEETYSESITVEALAETLGLDRSYFSSLFKKKTGCTPHGYLIALRIRKARFLLLNTDHSIAEISELVGLDPRNFARLFRKETGETPLSYRNTRRQSERGAFMLSSL